MRYNILNRLNILVVCIILTLSLTATGRAEPIRFGLPTTLSIFQGDEMHKSVRMAVEEINAAGGVKVGDEKRPIELISADLRDALPGVPVPDALIGMEKMILDGKVDALVVGPIRSEALLPAMDILAKHKVPMIGTVAMTPASEEKIRKDPEKYKYVFRAGLNARYMVGYTLGALKHLEKSFGFKTIFAMVQDVMWARGTANAITGKLAEDGWKVLGTEAYPTGATDFSAGLLKARASGAQAILVFFDMSSSGILVKQWAAMKVPALLVGNIAPVAGPRAWELHDGKIAGVINTIMESGNIPIPAIPASARFYQSFEKQYGQPIQAEHGPAPSYESVYIMAEAIERAGTLEPEALAGAIKKTDRRGVMGRVRFDDGNQAVFGNNPEEQALGCMFQWREDGKRVVVYPESVAQDQVRLPAWMTGK